MSVADAKRGLWAAIDAWINGNIPLAEMDAAIESFRRAAVGNALHALSDTLIARRDGVDGRSGPQNAGRRAGLEQAAGIVRAFASGPTGVVVASECAAPGPQCRVCNDTGEIHDEGPHGWWPCECPAGQAKEKPR